MINLFPAMERKESEKRRVELFEQTNKEFFQGISDLVVKFQAKFEEQEAEAGELLGEGFQDFAIASILTFFSGYYLNRLYGKDLQYPMAITIKERELEQLAVVLLQRMLHITKNLKDVKLNEEMANSALFKRIMKERKEKIKNMEEEPKEE